jgi:hypothetical protein
MTEPSSDFLHEEANENYPPYAFKGYFIFLRKDGIIQIQFEKGFEGGLEDAKRMFQHILSLSPKKKGKNIVGLC